MSTMMIAGGGIGGLAAALAVVRAGYRAVVLERQPEFGELGAGIQLGPNAFRALEQLGVTHSVAERAVFVDRLRLMDALTGHLIAGLEVGTTFRKRYGHPYAVAHRGHLHRALLEACRSSDAVDLCSGNGVDRYDQDDDGVTVTLTDGRRLRGVGLIGADGLHSAVRGQLVGDGPPRVSGHTTYRAVIPAARMPEDLRGHAVTLWAGPGCHVVHYPIAGSTLVNLVLTRDTGADQPVAGRPVEPAEMAANFGHLHPSPRRLITLSQDWKAWALCDRDPSDRWQDGRVVLLGDAAHPMLQYAAQGACQALEDAVCLGDALAEQAPIPAFTHYTARRSAHTRRVQQASRYLGREIYHPSGPAADKRDAMFAAWTEHDLLDRLDWLYASPPAARPGLPDPWPGTRQTLDAARHNGRPPSGSTR
ncbi:FAD-dependent monooxygenase [Actinoplanes regularis]|uniref:FAD-dependent monooxygenase n=1 Tax=Actinoplanes regularis TaxID=52697 RepID=UPI002555118B|nr:FAD-dependent monooxygenase [Actinoplanes regularis]